MLEEVEFIIALKKNDFIKSIFLNNNFSQDDLAKFDSNKQWENYYIFNKFIIGRWVFDNMNLSLSNEHLIMKFKMSGLSFIEELPFVLGTGPTYDRAILPQESSMMRTKVGNIFIEGRLVRVSYVIAKPYGSEITLHAINKFES